MKGVTLLPQELACAKEGTRGFFPAYDVCPLVYEYGQIAITFHPLGIHGADDGFGSGAHDKLFFERRVAYVCDKRDFGSKSLDVIRLFDEKTIGDKHGEVCVLCPVALNLALSSS